MIPDSRHSKESLDVGTENVAYEFMAKKGINEEIVRHIWQKNGEPDWMLEQRLKCLEIFKTKNKPTWWPDLSRLNLDEICYYAKVENENMKTWDDVPENIKATFDRLWIPEAEKMSLAGVGAQYDSAVVYHSLKTELQDKWVIFKDMSLAIWDHEETVKKHFMRAVGANEHLFAALHGAVWSGGTFLYVPKWVVIAEPLQAYFRMNVKSGGQFEHTLIIMEDDAQVHYIEGCSAPKYGTESLHAGLVEIFVGKRAKMRYSSVENWSLDTYNLNTKRAIVEEDAFMEWVGGNLGSGTTMLYPCSVLKGNGSRAEHIGIAVAAEHQNTDTGAKVIHVGENTSSRVVSKSISKGGGISTYRWLIHILPSAKNAVTHVDCDGLILDDISASITLPDMKVEAENATIAHEATAGKINEDELFYLQSRWLTEEKAKTMIVHGFISPIVRELPLEYASEMNVLITMEMEKGHG